MNYEEWLEKYLGLIVGVIIGIMIGFAIGFGSCSSAHSATYGNDVSATSVVVATATAAGADTTRGGR